MTLLTGGIFRIQANHYFESEPILWIPSEIFCRFLSRRIHELEAIQLRLYKSPPPNYGLLTSIIVHLMRNVSFSVSSKRSYLTEALCDLNYESTIHRFGMFFLHDLDITQGQLHPVMQRDNGDVDKAMGLHKKGKKRATRTMAAILTHHPDLPNDSFPLGEAPTWSDLQSCLKHDPIKLIKPWVWNSAWDKDADTSELFNGFTNDVWLALDHKVLSKPLSRTRTLKDSMELWSVASIKTNFLDVSFIPNGQGISKKKKSCWSFRDLASKYFPDPTVPLAPKSAWSGFREHGYLKRYQELKDRLTPARFKHLQNNLKLLFDNIQCLPSHGKPGGRIWKSRLGTVEILTNPKHYKLKSIGNTPRTARKKVIRVNAHPAEVSARLGEIHSGIPTRVSKKSRRAASRANKKINARKRNNPTIQEDLDTSSSEHTDSDETPSPSYFSQTEDELEGDELEGDSQAE
jgi:hypothetical protein